MAGEGDEGDLGETSNILSYICPSSTRNFSFVKASSVVVDTSGATEGFEVVGF